MIFLCWRGYNNRRRKISDCEAGIYFSAVVNEQTSDEIGQEARERGFASYNYNNNRRRKIEAASDILVLIILIL